MTSAEGSAIRGILAPIPEPVIFELGAHTGEDFEALLAQPMLHIMVEPDPHNAAQIYRSPKRYIIQGAVGRYTEHRKFHRSSTYGSGSILPPTGHLTTFPDITFNESFDVQCYSLDELFHNFADHIDLLYVDIQGAEAEMIQGGQNALAHTRYLFMEAEEVEFYAGQVLRPELLAMLPDWNLLATFDYNVLLENTRVLTV